MIRLLRAGVEFSTTPGAITSLDDWTTHPTMLSGAIVRSRIPSGSSSARSQSGSRTAIPRSNHHGMPFIANTIRPPGLSSEGRAGAMTDSAGPLTATNTTSWGTTCDGASKHGIRTVWRAGPETRVRPLAAMAFPCGPRVMAQTFAPARPRRAAMLPPMDPAP